MKIKTSLQLLAALLLAVGTGGCLVPEYTTEFDEDIIPPVFQEICCMEKDTVTLAFNEPVTTTKESVKFDPDMELVSVSSENNEVVIKTGDPLSPGVKYTIELTVADASSNESALVTAVFGHNPDVPGIIINEFTTRGSASHPDIVELLVTQPGNMAGLTLYRGVAHDFDELFVFGELEVVQNDYILVHFKPEGIEQEVNEYDGKAISSGLDCSDDAYDFWIHEGAGLGGNNGAICLYETPTGSILDALIYTNRTSQSDENYRGFGSTTNMERAELIFKKNQWVCGQNIIRPEDCIFIDDSTATRSACRESISTDTNSNADWHIVPTSGSTFGGINSDERY